MSTEQKITTKDGQVVVTVIDESSLTIDRIMLYFIKNSHAAIKANVVDGTPTVPKAIKDILIKDVEKR